MAGTNPEPACVIFDTVKGKGVSFAEDTYVWHSNTVNDEVVGNLNAAKAVRLLSDGPKPAWKPGGRPAAAPQRP